MSGCQANTPQQYEDCGAPAMGLARYGVDPNVSAIKAAVQQSQPSGAPSGYLNVCEAMLRAGGLIYYKSTPGDCGSISVPTGISSGQITGLAGGAASGVVGGLGAVGVLSGAATLGIGSAITLAVAGISDIFAHHAEAVANEQATICKVALYFNQAKQAIDKAVRYTQISPDEGVSYLIQVANQAKTGLSTIMKSCNAACVYMAICNAFTFYARTWYDYIAPRGVMFTQAPGGPPTGYGTAPGGVTVSPSNPAPPIPLRALPGNIYAPAIVGSSPPLNENVALPGDLRASDYLNLGYNQQTGQSTQAADVPPPTPINWGAVAAIAAVVLLLFTISKG